MSSATSLSGRPDATVRPEMTRAFAFAMTRLINSVIVFLDSTPIALQGSSPDQRAQQPHIDGLRLLQSSIQKSLDEPVPETRLTVTVADNADPNLKEAYDALREGQTYAGEVVSAGRS